MQLSVLGGHTIPGKAPLLERIFCFQSHSAKKELTITNGKFDTKS